MPVNPKDLDPKIPFQTVVCCLPGLRRNISWYAKFCWCGEMSHICIMLLLLCCCPSFPLGLYYIAKKKMELVMDGYGYTKAYTATHELSHICCCLSSSRRRNTTLLCSWAAKSRMGIRSCALVNDNINWIFGKYKKHSWMSLFYPRDTHEIQTTMTWVANAW